MQKKITVLAAAMIALLWTNPSYGQKETFIYDDFESGISTGWDAEKTSRVYTLNDGTSLWGGWLYDPNGELLQKPLEERVEGLVQFHSVPFSIPAGEDDVILSMNIWYIGLEASTERNLGVRLRRMGGEWDTLYAMRKDGETLPAAASPGNKIDVSENLGTKYNGTDSLEMQIFYYNAPEATDAFFAVVDNVILGSYTDAPGLGFEITTPGYTRSTSMKVEMNVRNLSKTDITAARYQGSIDGIMLENPVEFKFSTALGINGTSQKTFYFNIAETFGDHVLALWPESVNGTDVTAEQADTLFWVFTYVNEAELVQPRLPILEEFTSSTCGPCATYNRTLNPLIEELQGKMNVVKYPMFWPGNGDPYFKEEFSTRIGYYDPIFNWGGYLSAPTAIYNGESVVTSWTESRLKEAVLADVNTKSLIDLTVTGFHVDEEAKTATVELEILPHVNVNAQLFVNIVELLTTGNRSSNGEREFHHVMMKMGTGANGETVVLENGKPSSLTYEIDMDGTNVEEMTDLRVVCFLQDKSSGSIYQSAGRSLSGPDPEPGVATQTVEAMNIVLYPNPATEETVLAGLNRAHVEIYDLSGRRIADFRHVENQLSISVAGFNAGTYIVRIIENGQVVTRKLTVVK